MQGASRDAAAAAQERFDGLLRTDRDAGSRRLLAESLFELTTLLDRELGLRRTLADPSLEPERKAGLVDAVFGAKVGAGVLDLLRDMARSRWSRPHDLVDTLERLAASAAFAGAETAGTLDSVEDELFRFGRIVDGNPGLRAALTESATAERKAALVRELLTSANSITATLVTRLVTEPRGRTLEQSLADYGRLAAMRRERIVANVRVAVPMTTEQTERMSRSLARLYGQQVVLQVEIDPDVLGGVAVRVGDEIIDGTVANRLGEAGRRLTGH